MLSDIITSFILAAAFIAAYLFLIDFYTLSNSKNKIKRKGFLFWWFSPLKLEKYLEKMEARGKNLIDISKRGFRFYFLESTPRKFKYAVIYDKGDHPGQLKDNWELLYASSGRADAYMIYRKEYFDEPPLFYESSEHELEYERAVFRRNIKPASFLSCAFLFLTVFFSQAVFKYLKQLILSHQPRSEVISALLTGAFLIIVCFILLLISLFILFNVYINHKSAKSRIAAKNKRKAENKK